MSDEINVTKTALEWAWAGVLGLVGVLWKVNSTQHDRHRETQIKLFDKIEAHDDKDTKLFSEVTEKMTDGFTKLSDTMHEYHAETLRTIGKRKR